MGNFCAPSIELRSNRAGVNVLNGSNRRLCEQQLLIEMSRERFATSFSLLEEAVKALVPMHSPATQGPHRDPRTYNDADDFIAASIASLPSSLTCCVGLIERGLYREAAVLNQSFLDLLITICYLQRNPGRANTALRWIRNNPSRIRVFYQMIAPGLYDRKRGQCKRKSFASVFSANQEIIAKHKITAGAAGGHEPTLPYFEEETCQVMLDELLVLLLGWFRVYHLRRSGSPFAVRKIEPGERNLTEFFSSRIDVRDEQAVWRLLSRPSLKLLTTEQSQENCSVTHGVALDRV